MAKWHMDYSFVLALVGQHMLDMEPQQMPRKALACHGPVSDTERVHLERSAKLEPELNIN